MLKVSKVFQNKLAVEIHSARDQYLCSQFFCSMNKSDELWRKLNGLLNRSTGPSPVTEIQAQDKELTGTDLANTVNSYFTEIASNFVDSNTHHIRKEKLVFLTPISESEVMSVFMGLNNSKCGGADGIAIKPVKFSIGDVTECLAHVYNLCLNQEHFRGKCNLPK